MENTVLGTNNEGTIVYQKLTSQYLKDACDVTVRTLFTSGNVCRALRVPDDPEALAELKQLPFAAAKDGISVIAIDKNTDRVIGVAINKFLMKSVPFFENFRTIFKNAKALRMIEFIIDSDKLCDIFKHCKVNCVMEILFLGVLLEYRKQGIAKRLCEFAVDIAQNLNDGINVKQALDGSVLGLEPFPEVVYAMFTSFISQKIGRELGFEIAAKQVITDVKVLGQGVESSNLDTPTTTLEFKRLKRKKKLHSNSKICIL